MQWRVHVSLIGSPALPGCVCAGAPQAAALGQAAAKGAVHELALLLELGADPNSLSVRAAQLGCSVASSDNRVCECPPPHPVFRLRPPPSFPPSLLPSLLPPSLPPAPPSFAGQGNIGATRMTALMHAAASQHDAVRFLNTTTLLKAAGANVNATVRRSRLCPQHTRPCPGNKSHLGVSLQRSCATQATLAAHVWADVLRSPFPPPPLSPSLPTCPAFVRLSPTR